MRLWRDIDGELRFGRGSSAGCQGAARRSGDGRRRTYPVHAESEEGPRAVTFTPSAKKVLELSLREAQQLGDTYIGTEHLLLGLIREGEGIGAPGPSRTLLPALFPNAWNHPRGLSNPSLDMSTGPHTASEPLVRRDDVPLLVDRDHT
jgi:hypothetical protein